MHLYCQKYEFVLFALRPSSHRSPRPQSNCYRSRRLPNAGTAPRHYVFPACENGHIDPTTPQKSWRSAWRSLRKEASWGGFRFHDLRHHAITELAARRLWRSQDTCLGRCWSTIPISGWRRNAGLWKCSLGMADPAVTSQTTSQTRYLERPTKKLRVQE